MTVYNVFYFYNAVRIRTNNVLKLRDTFYSSPSMVSAITLTMYSIKIFRFLTWAIIWEIYQNKTNFFTIFPSLDLYRTTFRPVSFRGKTKHCNSVIGELLQVSHMGHLRPQNVRGVGLNGHSERFGSKVEFMDC